MKKTVTINISGIAFTIDEDAFEKLSAYLDTIRGYFKYSEGQGEIMADIEARVAEMLSKDMGESKQVVNMEDIERIISIMGQPEDYIDEEVEEEIETARQKHKQRQKQQSGPKSAKRTRLFRDPDRRVVGGVCAGIGHYFGLDPVWIRLLWILGVLFFGSGIFLYIIFWIAMPEAKSSAEKLEMKREPVNIDNIGRVVEEEMESVKKKLEELSDSNDLNSAGSKIGTAIERLIHFIINLIGLIFKAVGKLLGGVFLIIGTLVLICLLAMWLGADSIHVTNHGVKNGWDIYEMSNLIFGSTTQKTYAIIGTGLAIGIPFLALIYGGFKIIFRPKKGIPGMGIILTVLWVIGIVMCGVSAIFLTNDFQNKGVHNQDIQINVSDSLILKCGNDFYDGQRNGPNALYYEEENGAWKLGNTKLNIKPSLNDQYLMNFQYNARGKTYKDAIANARKVRYDYDLTGKSLELDPFIIIEKDQWRNQRLNIEIMVPKGKYLRIEEGMDLLLYDIDNKHHMLDSEMPGNLWFMNLDGELECVTCRNL
jgi:phage shock protein PspC (stress-responsive transcriptional regulator)